MSARLGRIQKVLVFTPAIFLLIAFILRYTLSRHSHAWRNASDGLELLGLLLWMFGMYKFPSNVPAPDPTIHLFPKPTEDSPESRNQ
jgi:hypothetical protein